MKYHKQKLLYTPDAYPSGSCYPTVYACILDMELEEVPYFNLLYFDTNKQKENFEKYIKYHYEEADYEEEIKKSNIDNFTFDVRRIWDQVRRLWLISMGYEEQYIADINKWLKENAEREYMAHGRSPRTGHVVVYRNGQMIHDPHLNNDGLVKIDYFSYLRKIEGDWEYDRYYEKIKEF